MTDDQAAIVAAINDGIAAGGWARLQLGTVEHSDMIEVLRAVEWRSDGKLIVEATDWNRPSSWDVKTLTLALPEQHWSRLLENLTSRPWSADEAIWPRQRTSPSGRPATAAPWHGRLS